MAICRQLSPQLPNIVSEFVESSSKLISEGKNKRLFCKCPLMLKNNLYTCVVISEALTQGNLSYRSTQITFYSNYYIIQV